MYNFILVSYCCKTTHPNFTGTKPQKLLLLSQLVLGIGWAELAVNWDLSGGCCWEHLHGTTLWSLGFLTMWWLGLKDCVPRENQAEVVLPFLADPQKTYNLTSAILFVEAAIGLPRFKGRGHRLHLCMGARQGFRRACRAETIVLAICEKYNLQQEINPQWSTPLWPCSLWQVSSSLSLITHDQADLSFQWPSFRGEEWAVGRQILHGQKNFPGSSLEAPENPHQTLTPLGVKHGKGVVAEGTKGIDQQLELHHPLSLFIFHYCCCSFSCF